MTTSEKIYIFDTTLRDGEQSPGATMTPAEKMRVAEVLDAMRVDIIEAGFAISSQGDFEAIHAIARAMQYSRVCSLARAVRADIERAGEAVKPAQKARIHTFVSTSPIHLKYQIRKTQDEVLELIRESVGLARSLCNDVEWSGMDATRTDIDYLCQAVETAIHAGATTVNIPDTVGYAIPEEYAETIRQLKNRVPNIDKAIISVHCQNDLGLATANSLSAVQAGARQVECTINGIGERAGNTSLEEVVMAFKTRSDFLPYEVDIDTTQIMRVSKLVSSITGFQVQPNKAIVGKNAFAHESGIHQDGVLKHAETYEIMTPESIGLKRNNLVLGKHSGRAAFRDKLRELGIVLGDNAFEDAFNRFKDLADKKKTVYDEDILSLVDEQSDAIANYIELVSLDVHCGTAGQKAAMVLKVNGKEHKAESKGDGPVDATFKCIRAIVPHKMHLNLYQVSAVTQGIDAQAEVLVQLETEEGQLINGNGADTDTLLASAKAYINALNKLQIHAEKIIADITTLEEKAG